MPIDAAEQLIVALDVDTAAEALTLADRLRGTVRWVKVATRLYTQAGPDLVLALRARGHRVFLDLKFHDIPAQVEGACRGAAGLGVSLLTVHASGGPEMLRAAVRGAAGADCGVLAVTVLTSLDAADLVAVGIPDPPLAQVLRLARLAQTAGCAGVVASPLELEPLGAALPGFPVLTPGIRPAGAAAGDQKRVLGPADAIARGARWLVVGRPITEAPDPQGAAAAILAEMARR